MVKWVLFLLANPMMTMSRDDRKPRQRILVAGLGNVLLQDDGVGVHAVRELCKHRHSGVVVAEVGTAVFDALHLLEWADKVLVIDAMKAGHPPGTIYLLAGDSVEQRRSQTSLHELSLLSAFNFIPRDLKPEIMVLGIEPEAIDYGLELTPLLRARLPRVIEEVKNMINRWKRDTEIIRFPAVPAVL
jgi:hydrogenase maturation protease